MPKHTPAPWTIDSLMADDGENEEITVCANHGDAIAVIALAQNYDSQAEANARLIAAAPDMLGLIVSTYDRLVGVPKHKLSITESRFQAVAESIFEKVGLASGEPDAS